MINIEPGDAVFWKATRETLVVLRISGDRLHWAGWPPGCAPFDQFLLVEKNDGRWTVKDGSIGGQDQ